MNDYAIAVENLSKKYVIGHDRSGGPTTFRDMLSDGTKALTRRLIKPRHRSSPTSEDFWALKDVSFGIQPGERVGIVGRNGAGKSTLLKILSRITEPSTGRIRIQGRVASLLEVGTGFHPELTGRENIYLNGAVLGMSRTEIKRKFDEIVDFSEVEKFLDTPVKRYSSGMYVRLAFAVAAHLEPEILIVDEVLAVGDSQFQKKCLGKMEAVGTSGRTVLFVSHQMAAVTALCDKAIWLVGGQVKLIGEAEAVTSRYMLHGADNNGEVTFTCTSTSSDKPFFFKHLALFNEAGEVTSNLDVRHPIRMQLDYGATQDFGNVEIALRISNSLGITILTLHRSVSLGTLVQAGEYVAEVELPGLFLAPGSYSIDIAAHIPNIQMLSYHQSVLSFEIEETGSHMSIYRSRDYGVVLADFPWQERNLAEHPVPGLS